MNTDDIAAIVGVASNAGVEPEALLAVVEIESRGKPFEADGVTPTFLFEKHIFWRQLHANNPAKLSMAISQGLALKSWSRSNYGGQGTSAGKLLILQQARAIDAECANKSCSWGVGQIMGFNATGLNYESATQMVNVMSANSSGFAAQVDAMVRFIKSKGLNKHLATHNWTAFAIGYNGAAQAQNRYDTKLKTAYVKWLKADINRSGVSQPVENGVLRRGAGDRVRVEALQNLLRAKGYPVGAIDGIFGAMTETAVFSFQSQNGLPTTGVVDADTLAKLNAADKFPISPERANANENTLVELGSKTVKEARTGRALSTALTVAGAGGLIDSILKSNGRGILELLLPEMPNATVKMATGQIVATPETPAAAKKASAVAEGTQVAPALNAGAEVANALPILLKAVPAIIDPAGGLPLIALTIGVFMWRKYKNAAAARLQDHRQGLNQAR